MSSIKLFIPCFLDQCGIGVSDAVTGFWIGGGLKVVPAMGATRLGTLDYSCLLHLKGLGVPAARDLKFYRLAKILATSS